MSNSTESSRIGKDLDDESEQSVVSSSVVLITVLIVVGLLLILTLIKVVIFVRSRVPREPKRSSRREGITTRESSPSGDGQWQIPYRIFNSSGKIEAGRPHDGESSQNGRSYGNQVGMNPSGNPSYNRTGCDLRRSDEDDGLYDDTEKYAVRGDPPGASSAAVPHGLGGNPYDYPPGAPRAAVQHRVGSNPYDYPTGPLRAAVPQEVVGNPYDYPTGSPRAAVQHRMGSNPYDYPTGPPRAAVPQEVVGNPYDYPTGSPKAAVQHRVGSSPYDYPCSATRAVQPTYDYPQHTYPPQQAIYDHAPSNPVPVRGGNGRSIHP